MGQYTINGTYTTNQERLWELRPGRILLWNLKNSFFIFNCLQPKKKVKPFGFLRPIRITWRWSKNSSGYTKFGFLSYLCTGSWIIRGINILVILPEKPKLLKEEPKESEPLKDKPEVGAFCFGSSLSYPYALYSSYSFPCGPLSCPW